MDHGIEVPSPAPVEPVGPATPADAEPPMPIPVAAPAATTVAAEPVAPVATDSYSDSTEYLIGAAVLVCLAAIWKAYRKIAQKQKR